MNKLKIIMHRDLSTDQCDCDPDKAVYADYYQVKINKALEQLEDECCEHDFYYVVEVEI